MKNKNLPVLIGVFGLLAAWYWSTRQAAQLQAIRLALSPGGPAHAGTQFVGPIEPVVPPPIGDDHDFLWTPPTGGDLSTLPIDDGDFLNLLDV